MTYLSPAPVWARTGLFRIMDTEFRRINGAFLSPLALASCSNESKKLLKEPRFFRPDLCCLWADDGGGGASRLWAFDTISPPSLSSAAAMSSASNSSLPLLKEADFFIIFFFSEIFLFLLASPPRTRAVLSWSATRDGSSQLQALDPTLTTLDSLPFLVSTISISTRQGHRPRLMCVFLSDGL